VKKILVVRFSSIGDIVLTTPIVRCLKKDIPNVEIHYLTKKQFVGLVDSNPNIDKVHSIVKDTKEIITELKEENFDCIIDLHSNLRTLKLKYSLNIKSYPFPKLNYKKWLLTTFKINKMPDLHIVDRYFETVKSFGVKNDNLGLDFFIPEKDEVNLADHYIEENFIAYAVGAQFDTKKLPTDKIIELLNRTKKTIVLLGGPSDIQEARKITDKCRNVINLCGDLNLNQSASVIKQASKVISHDTGLMHIASAFKKPIISIWGNTVPELGMYPYQPTNQANFSIHQVNNLRCRPCSKIGHQSCPKKHFKCMTSQNLGEIALEIEK